MSAENRRFRCKIVGLNYFPVKFDVRASIVDEAIQLKPNPQNNYDKNAIMVILRGEQIGHIDRDSAKLISQVFPKFLKYKCEIVGFDQNGYHINVIIHAEMEYDEFEFRRSISQKGPCIYRLWATDLNGREESYVGQTGDLANRLGAHERDLNLGNHSNFLLQGAFNTLGAVQFKVEVLSKLTVGLSPIKAQISLLDGERKYIRHFKQLGTSLNREDAFLVTTIESEDQFRNELKSHEIMVGEYVKNKKRERREVNGKIDAVKARIREVRFAKYENEKIIKENTGLRSFFTRQKLTKGEIERLRALCVEQASQIGQLIETTTSLEELKTGLKREIGGAGASLMDPYLKRYRQERDAARRQNHDRMARKKYRDRMLLEEDPEEYDDELDDDDDV